MTKICPKCLTNSVRKDGKENGRQRYKCMNYKYIFRGSRRKSQKQINQLFQDYSIHKQTLSELADDSSMRNRA